MTRGYLWPFCLGLIAVGAAGQGHADLFQVACKTGAAPKND